MNETHINEVPSLITRDASTAIKGLMILLIVLGHTNMLSTSPITGERFFYRLWLYSFHVYIFFILPIIYGFRKRVVISDTVIEEERRCIDIHSVLTDLKHSLIKIGVPYGWFFLLSVIVYVTVGGGQFNIIGILYAFVWGNEPLIDEYIGFNFIWFLPSMLAVLTLKSLYYNSNRYIKITILGISSGLWILAILKILSQYTIGMYIPFALSHGFYFFILGILSRFLINNGLPIKSIPLFLLIIVAFSIFLYYKKSIHLGIDIWMIIRLVMPVLVFSVLYIVRDSLSKSNILKYVGKYTLQIYLVHVFVLNALESLSLNFIGRSISIGIAIYVLTIGVSIVMAKMITKVHFLNRLVFPKG